MENVARGLASRGIATLRYQFPYMERGSRRPDPPPLAQATVRAAVAEARGCCRTLPLIAGGKSFGGRMTSQAQATRPRGRARLGIPRISAASGRPAVARARRASVRRADPDALPAGHPRRRWRDLEQLEPICKRLGTRATLKLFPDADHSFHVPARTGRKDAQVLDDVLDALAAWLDSVILRPGKKA